MPNEQTSVPLFASGEVLTAANMNLSAGTGVPVFTNTTTRDAAFGGANEKVLAEGQLCYLSSTNVVQYYDGAAWATVGPSTATPRIAQIVQATYATQMSLTSTSFITSNLTATITPTVNTSKVYIVYTGGAETPASAYIMATMFRGTVSGTNLAADGFTKMYNVNNGTFAINFLDSPATTSATTYTLGVKVQSGTGYIHPNGVTSVLTLMEVLV
jgi:hypothetical protein